MTTKNTTRKRSLELVDHETTVAGNGIAQAVKAHQPTEEMKAKAKAVILANQEKNAQSRAEAKALKELLALMTAKDIKDFTLTFFVEINGEKTAVRANAIISAGESSYIDPVKFRKAVGDEIFMRCVSVSKKDAEANAPTNTVEKCTVTETKDPALKVSVLK